MVDVVGGSVDAAAGAAAAAAGAASDADGAPVTRRRASRREDIVGGTCKCTDTMRQLILIACVPPYIHVSYSKIGA